jgi:hypothetical protein
MTKMLTVLKNEIYVLVSRRSFWFGTLGVPLIAFLIYAGITWINRSQGGNGLPTSGIGAIFTREEDTRPQGYVDQSGLITQYPDDFPRLAYIGYTNIADARHALDAGEISA